jgi:hypothetical protein
VIDHETLIDTLLKRDFPNSTVVPEYDVDLLSEFPILFYLLSGAGQDGNGPTLWSASLTVYCHGVPDVAFSTSAAVYDAVHAWQFNGVVPDVGWVTKVTDISLPDRDSSSSIIGDKDVVQYAASYALKLRN